MKKTEIMNQRYKEFYFPFLLFILSTGSIVLFTYFYIPVMDDGRIVERYIFNHYNGLGLVYNEGDTSYGYTSIFGTLINAWIAKLISPSMDLLRFIVPSLCLFFIFAVNHNILFEKKLIPSLLATFSPAFIYYSFSGLDSFFIVFFSYLFGFLIYKEKFKFVSICIGISPFFRPELLVLVFPLMLYIAYLNKYNVRNCILFLACFISPVVLAFLYLVLNYEFIFPQSVLAKSLASVFLSSFLKTSIVEIFGYFKNNFFQMIAYLIFAISGLFFALNTPKNLNASRKNSTCYWVILFCLAIYALSTLVTRAYYPWYFSPISYLFGLIVLSGYKNYRSVKDQLSIFVCLLLYLSLGTNLVDRTDKTKTYYMGTIKDIANAVKGLEAEDNVIVIGAAGYAGMYLQQYELHDIQGLDSPEIVKLRKERGRKDANEVVYCQYDWNYFVLRYSSDIFRCEIDAKLKKMKLSQYKDFTYYIYYR